MAGPFVTEEMFEVVVRYVERTMKSGLSTLMVLKPEDKEKELRYKDSIKEIHSQWSQPNWKESNELIRVATKWDSAAGMRVIDWPLYRTSLLENYMKGWDIQDEGGKTVPCVKEYIDKLDPNVASALVDEFLSKTTPTEKELGE